MIVLAFLLSFFSGAVPFSVWIGRLALKTDIRQQGDGNPGATNVLRSGGRGWFALAAALDYGKGVAPAGIAHIALGWTGLDLALVAIAPILGHAFSPFLGWRGGKAVAVTLGVWTGLTVWEGPTWLGIFLGVWYALIAVDGWAVMLAMGSMLAYLLLTPPAWNGLGLRAEGADILLIWVGNLLILAWKHRADLQRRPGLRPWLQARWGR
ncbi:MAG: glycerol-3-phosphate acyltransferase [Candidatus Promineifilaceae bacterium]